MSFEPQRDGNMGGRLALSARLLIVLPMLPWPLRQSGISMRFAPIIEYLAQRYWVDVLVLTGKERTLRAPLAASQCGSVEILPVPTLVIAPFLRKMRTLWRGLLPGGEPFGFVRHANERELESSIASRIHGGKYRVVLWAAGHLAMACRLRAAFPSIRFVNDFVDSPTLLCSREVTSHILKRTFRSYSVWKWRRLEKMVQDRFDATIYISPIDASTARPGGSSGIFVIPNGVAEVKGESDCNRVADTRGVIGFLGDMSYAPNISAALRLGKVIFPLVRAEFPGAKLLIIGRNPAASIRALESPDITVTGSVDNIGAYLAKVAVFVFPMLEGAGLQNKILDAMRARVAVVTTPIAAASLGVVSGSQLLIGETDSDLAQHAIALLRDPEAAAGIACRAYDFVMQSFSWRSLLPRYERVVLPNVP